MTTEQVPHPRCDVHDHDQEMICGYDRKVYLCILADRFENAGPVHPVVHRFHDLGLHDDQNEDGNVYGTELVSVHGREGRRVTVRTEDETEGHLSDGESLFDSSEAHVIRIQGY